MIAFCRGLSDFRGSRGNDLQSRGGCLKDLPLTFGVVNYGRRRSTLCDIDETDVTGTSKEEPAELPVRSQEFNVHGLARLPDVTSSLN